MKYGTMIFGLCAAAALLSAGCGAHKSASPTSTASRIQPANFVARVDNPWFPLTPGTTYVYRGVKDHKPARDVLAVTHQTKLIQGVRCITLHDRLFLSGRLHERTTDWYAQDKDGNVWYFGESTAELDKNGKVTSTE